MKKTPWFPAGIRPVHPGVYEVHRSGGFCESFGVHKLRWVADHWEYEYPLGISSKGDFASMTDRTGDQWRGLTEPA